MTFCLFSPDGFTRASFEQRICKAVAQKKACNSARVLQIHEVPVTVVDWSNVNFHIHDGHCSSEALVCHFEICAVGVRCELFLSIAEASSYFEEGIASMFGEEKSVQLIYAYG